MYPNTSARAASPGRFSSEARADSAMVNYTRRFDDENASGGALRTQSNFEAWKSPQCLSLVGKLRLTVATPDIGRSVAANHVKHLLR